MHPYFTGPRGPRGPYKRKPLSVRFWAKVDRRGPDDCWPWLGAFRRDGYGVVGAGGWHGTPIAAHRVSWELINGPVLGGLCVLHRCDNKPCVNPSHLFLGTKRDNTQDMLAKQRGRWHRYPHDLRNHR